MSEPTGPEPAHEEERPGRGLVYLAEDTVARLLGLPGGYRVVGVSSDFRTLSVVVVVETADLKRLPEGYMPPTLAGAADVEYRFDPAEGDTGGPWVRWRWQPGEQRPRPRYGCGFGPCGQPAAYAFAVRTRRDVWSPEGGKQVLLLCAGHRDTPPAGWAGVGPAEPGGGRADNNGEG